MNLIIPRIDSHWNEMTSFSVILARDSKSGGIGYQGKLPWSIPEDLAEFKRITTTNSEGKMNTLIMGRLTWESIGRPLPKRKSIVVSTTLKSDDVKGAEVVSSFADALTLAQTYGGYIFVIGGAQLYEEAWFHSGLESIYLTEVTPNDATYDTIFDTPVPAGYQCVSSLEIESPDVTIDLPSVSSKEIASAIPTYRAVFNHYQLRAKTSEQQYLNLLDSVLTTGEVRPDRTGVGTISKFGAQMEFDLQQGFPLLTTKRVPLRVIFEELMWFLRGQTNVKQLHEKKVHIWDGNSSPAYMKSIGLEKYPEGELGPVYGAQWRNFGGDHDPTVNRHIGGPIPGPKVFTREYPNYVKILMVGLVSLLLMTWHETFKSFFGSQLEYAMTITAISLASFWCFPQLRQRICDLLPHDRLKQGVDQIEDVIQQLRTNPTSRRIIVSAWNPLVLKQVALPSCHCFVQFYVREAKYLDAQVYIRSNDLFLGAPFNISSYGLMVHLIASMVKLTPGRLVYTIGDAHIYRNHIDQVKLQLSRATRTLPRLKVVRVPEKIEDFEFDMIVLEDYHPHPGIKAEMAV